MDKRRRADIERFAVRVFDKMILSNVFREVDAKLMKEHVCEEMKNHILKEMDMIIEDTERVRREKLRWVMN